LELWGLVAKTVAPLRPSERIDEDAAADKPETGRDTKRPPPAAIVPAARAKTRAAAPPSLATLDRRTKARVVRGAVAIDARIDLHGLTQQAAHGRLRRFLAEAQEADRKIVLVITGKGRAALEPGSEDRGVLRRMVPIWLAAPDLRPLVIGFEEAGRGHGGAGALYVRIRRRRGGAD
jgi:DNA-nicking Smr family endonuclease